MSADIEKQKAMYMKILIDSIKIVQEKSKGDFNGLKLIEDILSAIGES